MFEIAYTFRGSILFSFSTANIVTLEEKFKKWGNFFQKPSSRLLSTKQSRVYNLGKVSDGLPNPSR